jgi:cysteine desulfurase
MIYFDNAASTPPDPEVLATVGRAAEAHFANPSSAHGLGAAAARALEQARAEVAALLGAATAEIRFTSGGTEADALGVIGAALAARGRHVVASSLEHSAVLRSAEQLGGRGFTVSVVPSRNDGTIAPEEVVATLRPDTAVVAVMLVNNELGTVQPVAAIARALRAAGFRGHIHTDAVQAAGFSPVDVTTLGVDSLALSGHKLHGPKGVGALWVRPGARLEPLWDGGRQEKGLRSGTENVPGAVGLGRAAALARSLGGAGAAVAALRDRLEAAIFAALPAHPTVPPGTPRAPHISSVTLSGLPAEPLLHALEARGVYVSAGSACASRSKGPSHVLKAIGLPDDVAVLRFSLSRRSREEEIAPAVAALAAAIDEVAAVAAPPRRAGGARAR